MRSCLVKGMLVVGVLMLMFVAFSLGGYYGLKVGYEAGVNDAKRPDIACLTIVPADPAMQEAADRFAARYCDLEEQVRASCQSLVVTPEIQAEIDQYNVDVMSAMMAGQIDSMVPMAPGLIDWQSMLCQPVKSSV